MLTKPLNVGDGSIGVGVLLTSSRVNEVSSCLTSHPFSYGLRRKTQREDSLNETHPVCCLNCLYHTHTFTQPNVVHVHWEAPKLHMFPFLLSLVTMYSVIILNNFVNINYFPLWYLYCTTNLINK